MATRHSDGNYSAIFYPSDLTPLPDTAPAIVANKDGFAISFLFVRTTPPPGVSTATQCINDNCIAIYEDIILVCALPPLASSSAP